MTEPEKIPKAAQKTLEILQQVAAETLERKRRLGHYAIIWQDGKPIAVGEDAPEHLKVQHEAPTHGAASPP